MAQRPKFGKADIPEGKPAKPEPGNVSPISLETRVADLEYKLGLAISLGKTNHEMMIQLTKAVGDLALVVFGHSTRKPGKSQPGEEMV